jgi:hypothetical protein
MERQATPVEPNLDPRLQQMADRQRRGLHPAATASTEEGEIAVVAKVADREAWEALSEVRLGADLGGGPEIGGYIVTGRIPVSPRARPAARHQLEGCPRREADLD